MNVSENQRGCVEKSIASIRWIPFTTIANYNLKRWAQFENIGVDRLVFKVSLWQALKFFSTMQIMTWAHLQGITLIEYLLAWWNINSKASCNSNTYQFYIMILANSFITYFVNETPQRCKNMLQDTFRLVGPQVAHEDIKNLRQRQGSMIGEWKIFEAT